MTKPCQTKKFEQFLKLKCPKKEKKTKRASELTMCTTPVTPTTSSIPSSILGRPNRDSLSEPHRSAPEPQLDTHTAALVFNSKLRFTNVMYCETDTWEYWGISVPLYSAVPLPVCPLAVVWFYEGFECDLTSADSPLHTHLYCGTCKNNDKI